MWMLQYTYKLRTLVVGVKFSCTWHVVFGVAFSLSLSTMQVCIISNMYNVVRHFFGIVFTEQPKYLWGGELRPRMHVLLCTDAIHMHVYTCIHVALSNSPQYPSLHL